MQHTECIYLYIFISMYSCIPRCWNVWKYSVTIIGRTRKTLVPRDWKRLWLVLRRVCDEILFAFTILGSNYRECVILSRLDYTQHKTSTWLALNGVLARWSTAYFTFHRLFRSYNLVTEQHLQTDNSRSNYGIFSWKGDGRLRPDERGPDISRPEAVTVSSSASCHFAPFTRAPTTVARLRLRVLLPWQRTERVVWLCYDDERLWKRRTRTSV